MLKTGLIFTSSSPLQTGERTCSWESVGKKCFGQCGGSLKLHDQPKVTLGTVLPLGEAYSARARITYRKATYHPGWCLHGWPSQWGSNKKPAWGGGREKEGQLMSEDASRCEVTEKSKEPGGLSISWSHPKDEARTNQKNNKEKKRKKKKGLHFIFLVGFIMKRAKVQMSSSCQEPVTTTAGPYRQQRQRRRRRSSHWLWLRVTALFFFAQLIKLLTRKDCFSEKWRSVRHSPPVDLYSSVVKSIFLFVLTKVPL